MKFITTILSTLFCLSMQAQLVTYPSTLSTGMPHNDDYTVRVRIPGGEWNNKTYHGAAEWLKAWAKVPTTDWLKLMKQWIPQQFDAKKWAKMAKEMGV